MGHRWSSGWITEVVLVDHRGDPWWITEGIMGGSQRVPGWIIEGVRNRQVGDNVLKKAD